ncbi:hypothetical protein K1719_034302 [Acacia pycnantha]|nr:hypothetical protein K1719_034302 [Acacia pycnantha]
MSEISAIQTLLFLLPLLHTLPPELPPHWRRRRRIAIISATRNVDIPYPFSTTKGCFKDSDFRVTCHKDSSSGHPIPYLARETNGGDIKDHGIQIVNISGDTSDIHVSIPVSYVCYDPRRGDTTWHRRACILVPPKKKNSSSCSKQSSSSVTNNNNGTYSGDGCCQSDFDHAVANYTINVNFYDNPDVPVDARSRCSYAFVAQNSSFNFSGDEVKKLRASNSSTVVLDWVVDNMRSCGGAFKGNKTMYRITKFQGPLAHYYCRCKQGFEGNPYNTRTVAAKVSSRVYGLVI